MRHFTIYPHSGSGNHGCEAIIRSTAKLVQSRMIVYSDGLEEDSHYGIDSICTVKLAQNKISRFSINYIRALFNNRLKGQTDAFDRLVFHQIVDDAKCSDYFISAGGDNYCYGMPEYILLVNRMLDEKRIKRVLWGASIEPIIIKGRILEDLQGYHKIWSRESLTHKVLLDNGVVQSVLMPDPAFVMDCKERPLPEGFAKGNTVGINVSPMIIGYEREAGMTMKNYVQLIRYIINLTDMQVALIPHVVWSHNDDRKPLMNLYEQFKDSGRVIMIDAEAKLNAEELKFIISKCRFLVAARTHASIAAYSTQVPTLVVGYSVKARGIARDIFGSEENYVLPVQSMAHPKELTNAFCWLEKHEDAIRQHYQAFMPEYISRIEINRILND